MYNISCHAWDFYHPFDDTANGNPAKCLFHICVQIPAYALLAISSAYYIGKRRVTYNQYNTWNTSQSFLIYARSAVVSLLCVLPIASLMLDFGFGGHLRFIPDGALVVMKTAAWLVHLVYVLRLKRGMSYNTRGPRPAIMTWLICAITSGTELWVYREHWAPWVEGAAQGLYLLTLIPLSLNQSQYRLLNSDRNAYVSEDYLNQDSFVGFEEDYGYGHAQHGQRAKENENFFSKLTFGWVHLILMKGSCGELKSHEDLYELPADMDTVMISEQFQNTRVMNMDMNRKSLLRNLHSLFGLQFWCIGFVKIIADGSGFAGPILLNGLVSYIETEDSDEDDWTGFMYVGGLFLAAGIGTIATTHFNMWMNEINLKIRAAITTAIYSKTLLLRATTLEEFSSGQLINYMNTDTNRIMNFTPSFHAFWSLPVQIGVSLYLLYGQIGISFLAGVVFTICLIPVNRVIAQKIGKLSTKLMHHKDRRVKLMTEILYGIRTLKFHSWEDFFIGNVNEIRKEELKYLKGRKYLDALCVYFWATTPVLVSLLSFGTYVLIQGQELTASKVFTSLALFNMLISPLNALPWVINGMVESWVSVKRIGTFLEATETDPDETYDDVLLDPNPQATSYSSSSSPGTALSVQNATFEWKTKVALKNFSLEVRKGELIGLIGEVGSGKSTLLLSLTGELEKTDGSLCISQGDEGFGIVLQEPWIQRGSIKKNILFGKPYDPEFYSAVLSACCLEQDLQELGEDTIVGENGATLSGGQKARVALARAIYQDKSTYLLDDIFSAVDYKVGRHLYNHVILGLLKTKTRILCTHHVQFLKDANVVLVMDNREVIRRGPPAEILPIFYNSSELSDEKSINSERMGVEVTPLPSREEFSVEDLTELHQQGSISSDVYKFYFKSIGRILTTLIMAALVAMQMSKNAGDLWLAHWVSDTNDDSNTTTTAMGLNEWQRKLSFSWHGLGLGDNLPATVKYNLTILVFIGLLNSVCTLARAFLFAYGGIKGGTKAHVDLLKTVIKAKMSFYDKTPIGRILNRFSSDVAAVDDDLPFIFNIFLAQVVGLFGTLAITCYALPWILALVIPLTLVVLNIQEYYRITARQLRRLASTSLSPIYAHYSETLKGLVTIRAGRVGSLFTSYNTAYLESNQKCQYCIQSVAAWLGFRLQMVGVLVITGVGLIGVIQHRFEIAQPGIIGLAISYALTITSSLSGFVTWLTDTEKEFVAVERMHEYIDTIETESYAESKVRVPYGWPSQGVIEFKSVSVRYSEYFPYALRNVNFSTRPCEKLGVVGRTGSGKSTLFRALFRLLDRFEGDILIDTVGIKYLNLKELRSKMWVIPQDPLILSGTLRDNLDPRKVHSDEDILAIMAKSGLSSHTLDMDMGENGSHLSSGQKQLVCLARALLVNPKILCIDEATAHVDVETDAVIQKTIKTCFHHATVITIAHRINTILNSDRVLVMKAGEIVEFDQPSKLMEDKTSHFYQLAQGVV